MDYKNDSRENESQKRNTTLDINENLCSNVFASLPFKIVKVVSIINFILIDIRKYNTNFSLYDIVMEDILAKVFAV